MQSNTLDGSEPLNMLAAYRADLTVRNHKPENIQNGTEGGTVGRDFGICHFQVFRGITLVERVIAIL